MNIPKYHLKLIVDKRSRYHKEQIRYDGRAASVLPVLRREFNGADRELHLVVLLDNQWRVIGTSVTGIGSLREVSARPRDVFKLALVANAAYIIVAHNHPGGVAFPSAADRESHALMEKAGENLGVLLLDNIILGEGREYHSWREEHDRSRAHKLKAERDRAIKKSLRRIQQGTACARDVVLAAADALGKVPGMTRPEQVATISKVIVDLGPIVRSRKRIRRVTRSRAGELLYLAVEMLPVYEKGDFFSLNRIEQVLGFDIEPPKKPVTVPIVDFFEMKRSAKMKIF